MTLRITVPSRIHVTLVDLGAIGYRRNGGVGFCINTPAAEYQFEKHQTIDLTLLLAHGFNTIDIGALSERIFNVRSSFGVPHGLLLKEARLPLRHTGLGVGTATALACLEALFVLNDLPVEPDELIRLSGRGGTSGIGVHGYFSGGFIFDVGRRYDTDPLLSSDDIYAPSAIPLNITQAPMPDWPIGLFTPPNPTPVSRELERQLFSSAIPVPQEDVFETAYHVVFGIVAALKDNDYKAFCGAVNAIQGCPWKQHEIRLHGASLQHYMNVLKDLGCDAVGLSSVGPTLYFLSNDFPGSVERIKQRFPQASVIPALPNNHGRKVTYA